MKHTERLDLNGTIGDPPSAVSSSPSPAEHGPMLFAFTVAASLLVWTFLQPVIGDERLQYMPVFRVSERTWPAFNTSTVSYGIPAVYLWVVGGLTRIVHEPILVGRLLSWLAHATLLARCFVRGRLVHGLAFLVLLHPMTLLFAVRAHPFLPGLALLFAALTGVVARPLVAVALTFLATHVQAFLLPCTVLVPSWAWLRTTSERSRVWLYRCFLFGTVGLTGVVSNWLIYGGKYPPGFVETPTYREFNTGSPSLGYLVLIPACVGFWGWVAGGGFGQRPSMRSLLAAAAVTTVGAAIVLDLASGRALGPVASAVERIDYALYAVVLGISTAGWLWLPRDRRLVIPVVGTIVSIAAIAGLPWFYERYAWFAANTIMLFFGFGAEHRGLDGRERRLWLASSLLLVCTLALFHGIVVTNRIDPLWLWSRTASWPRHSSDTPAS